jgi:tight adherence protein B
MDALWVVLMSLCAGASAAALGVGVVRLLGEGGSRLMETREQQNQAALEELYIRGVTPRQITIGTAGVGIVAGLALQLLTRNPVLAVGALVGILFLPQGVFAYLRGQRRERFEEQLPEALALIANSARAGLSLTQAIEQVAERGTPPVSQEMSTIVQEIRLGSDLGKSIDSARHRLGSRNFNLVATALQVNRDKGGNLPEALETMANSLKEIWRLEQRLITASAEGRKAVMLISGMPIFIFLMVAIFEPSIPALLVASLAGMAMLILAVMVYAIGFWWLMRVLRRDV